MSHPDPGESESSPSTSRHHNQGEYSKVATKCLPKVNCRFSTHQLFGYIYCTCNHRICFASLFDLDHLILNTENIIRIKWLSIFASVLAIYFNSYLCFWSGLYGLKD